VKNGSIYVHPRPKSSLAHSAHIINFILPVKMLCVCDNLRSIIIQEGYMPPGCVPNCSVWHWLCLSGVAVHVSAVIRVTMISSLLTTPVPSHCSGSLKFRLSKKVWLYPMHISKHTGNQIGPHSQHVGREG